MLFGILWILAFLDAVEKFIIAVTSCMWYFSGDGSDSTDKTGNVSISLAYKWGFRYHMGTMAFGSMLIASMNMIKIIFEYFATKAETTGQAQNSFIKMVVWCTRCCIWCLDSCIRFINKNAYIQCALFSTPFCKSAREGFYLTVRNGGRFTSIDVIGVLISLLGKGIIISLAAYICIVICTACEVINVVVFVFIVALIAFIMSTLFMTIFEFSSLAIL
jgi:hypothetical protein